MDPFPQPAADAVVFVRYEGPGAEVEVDGKPYPRDVILAISSDRLEQLQADPQLATGKHVFTIVDIPNPGIVATHRQSGVGTWVADPPGVQP